MAEEHAVDARGDVLIDRVLDKLAATKFPEVGRGGALL